MNMIVQICKKIKIFYNKIIICGFNLIIIYLFKNIQRQNNNEILNKISKYVDSHYT
jgi:hypothetical protein